MGLLPKTYVVAEYPDMDFANEDRLGFHTFDAGTHRPLPDIDIQLPGRPIERLRDLTPESVAEMVRKEPQADGMYYVGRAVFWFKAGSLYGIYLDEPVDVQVGKRGVAMLKLPITRRDMIRVFGEPIRYGRGKEPPR